MPAVVEQVEVGNRITRVLTLMDKLFFSQEKKVCGVASVIFAIAGLLWFVICFTAREAKWWNSLWFFLFAFVLSISLGLIGRKSIGGIWGVIVGSLGLIVVSFLLYVR